MLIVILTLTIVLFWLLRDEFRKFYLAFFIPGPPGLPLAGNGLDLINKSPQELIQIISRYLKNHGNFIRIWLGNQLLIATTDPKAVQAIMTDSNLLTKSREYEYMEAWLGTGLLTSTNQKWLSRRKILTPAFHFKILDEFIEVFDKQGTILIEKLKKFDGKESFNIFPLVALCALDVICETAMGISLNSQSDSESQYVKNVNELADIIHRRTYDFIERYEFLFKFTKTYKRQQKLVEALHQFTESVIKSRRKEMKSKQNTAQEDEDFGIKKKKALLDLLLETTVEGKLLSNEDIREEIDTFMFEGHDTSASALAYTLYNIARYEHIQKKCFEEIDSVLGNDGKITMKSLNELKYLELVCKESLRLYPSVPIFGRRTVEEMMINDKMIPKDTTLLMLPYFMARDPEIWQNPEKFIPERHAVEKDNEDSQVFTYIPFSGGYRNCIGQKFAMLELKSTVSKVVLNYKLSVKENFTPEDALELVIKSTNGIMLKIESRKLSN
ncbi:hypothetical protein PVAND_008134 [Polypedilum vanderplanki]|uniref:Cytochrome P450 n=1 Tax=Polypedilum vanderplanki TaxID=319348 RepID=A0A9J6CA17_POLVA|nr:hypothetical protein PVAND_008134 [Polypedilum vanderplanki]